MATVHEVIDALRQAPTNSERGTKFEQLMVRYFELDPMLSQQYDQVWRWIDWPDRNGKADTGIDLVARERDTGELTAIQCKFYEPTTRWPRATSTRSSPRRARSRSPTAIIISTTDKWGKNAEDALEDQKIPVQRIGLAEIADSPIDWDIAWPQRRAAGRAHARRSGTNRARTRQRRSTRCSPGSPQAMTAAS